MEIILETNNLLIDGNLTEEEAHKSFCKYYEIVISKRGLMTKIEYYQYRNEVLAKASGRNIHNLTGIVSAILGFIDLAELKPDKIDFCIKMINECKSKIFKILC